jgi:hypothetical protein
MMKNTKKKTKKKGKKTSFEINPNFIQEYVESKNLSLEEIDTYIKRLIVEYEKEKEARNLFQLERDKLIEMREIEKKKFEDLKSELLNTHEQLSSLEQEHYQEISMFKKKVRYLMSEHQLKINNLKFEIENICKENIDENLKEKEKYVLQLRKFINSLNEKEDQYDDMIKNLTLEYENRISKLRQEHSETIKIMQKTMDVRFNDERAQFSLITRNAVHEITEIKNLQINELISINNKAYDDLRNYFKDLVNSSMILVSNLQEKSSKAVTIEKESVSKAKHFEVELKHKVDEAKKLSSRVDSLKQKADLYEIEKKLFQQRDIDCKKLNDKFTKLDIKYEMLLKTYTDLKKDYDAVIRNVDASNLIFQEKCNNRIFITNRKVEVLQKDLSRYEDFLKAFSFDNDNIVQVWQNKLPLVENSKFDFHEVLYQFRIRESVIDEQNRKLIEVCYRYNEVIELIGGSCYEARVLLDGLGVQPIKINKFCNDFKMTVDCL